MRETREKRLSVSTCRELQSGHGLIQSLSTLKTLFKDLKERQVSTEMRASTLYVTFLA